MMLCALVLLAFGLYLDPGGLGRPQPTVREWVLSGGLFRWSYMLTTTLLIIALAEMRRKS